MNDRGSTELYKLITRRYLAWGIGGLFAATASFVTGWGAVSGAMELVAAGIGIIGAIIGTIVGFYFGKKTSEE